MDELGKWFMDVFTSVNKGGRLAPPAASGKRVDAFLEQVGGEGVLKLATLLNIGDAEVVNRLAAGRPDLGEWLAGDEQQKSLDRYLAERSDTLGQYRKFVTRGLNLETGTTVASFADPGGSKEGANEAWEKVFQVIMRSESDDEESGHL